MQSRERYVIVGVIALAVVAAVALSHGLQWTWVQLGWNDPPLLSRELRLTTGLAYGVGAIAAAVVLKHPTTHQLALEIVEELSRVTWPSREETGSATVVVIVTVLIAAVYLGVFDAVWLWLTDWFLGVGAPPG